jgi:hypothetical protein
MSQKDRHFTSFTSPEEMLLLKKLLSKREILIPAGTLVTGLVIFTLISVLFIHTGAQRSAHTTKDPFYKVAYNTQQYGSSPTLVSKQLKAPVNAPTVLQSTGGTVAACKTPTLDLKILVLAGDGSEVDLPAIKQGLDYIGASYTVYTASQSPNGLTEAKLDDGGCHAYYNGVVLTTGLLAYNNGSQWLSGLSQTEWNTLWAFESKFGVRAVSWYTFPNNDFGFQNTAQAVSTTNTPYTGSLTAAGKSVFPYLSSGSLTIQNAYTYLDAPLTDGTTSPLITDSKGNALAAVHTYADGRQLLSLTFDNNPYLTHSIVLSYGLVNWVTKGLFIGQQGSYLESQIDDVFIDDNTWAPGTTCGTNVDDTPTSYRITGSDFTSVVNWQKATQANPMYRNLKLDMVFNGYGTEQDAYPGDTLTKTAKRYQNQFIWTNHTYDHAEMDNVDAGFVDSELQENYATAASMRFSDFTTSAMVTPSISGLRNGTFLNEAYANNIRYLVSDSSQAGQNNPAPNEGIQNWINPQILMVPRHPTNLFFNVSTPAEWVAEYNCLYHSFWGKDLTYQQILDIESDTLVQNMIVGNIDPDMYHQPNLRAYDGTHTLLGDLLDMTLSKYSALYNVPVTSLRLDHIGQAMADKTALRNSGVVASVTGKTVTITTQNSATIPLTGLVHSGSGYSLTNSNWVKGQKVAYIPVNGGQSVSVAISA